MMTMPIPDDPFALVGQAPFEPAGRSQRELFGAPVEIMLIPGRAGRLGIPGEARPTFQNNRADQIIAAEAKWRTPGMALTGNRFPFCDRQALLWSTERRREPTLAMLEVAFAIEDSGAGTSIVNSMGASGSVTRSHIHLTGGRSAFLAALPKSPIDPGEVHLPPEHLRGCELLRLDAPFPVIGVGVRGPAAARAQAFHHLLECRTPQAFNLVSSDQIAWLFPRSNTEIPASFFPQALGGAELAGRWCCNDATVYERLTPADMAKALRLTGLAWP